MKRIRTRTILALITFTVCATLSPAQQPPSFTPGQTDYQALIEAAPGLPSTPAEAARRTHNPDNRMDMAPVVNESLYAPFNSRLAAARDLIKDAAANRRQNQEALLERSKAQANDSPIVSRMGGLDKISEMSEGETQQAAAQAVGSYQQSLAGGPGNAGMQAMMERMMNDPAYQERFEKMTKPQQEAEMRKYMGNAPAPPVGETAAERRAQQAQSETTAVLARQSDLSDILQRIQVIDAEFTKKDQAIMAAPGGHDEIAKDIGARIEKLPLIDSGGEVGPQPDPVKVLALQRERAARDRARSAWELQQRSALYAQRKTRSKAVAASYAAWVKQNGAPVNSQTAQLLNDTNTEIAVGCEEDLIGLSEGLAKYTEAATLDAAQYERAYQERMTHDAFGMPVRPAKATN